jgi:hypothetical protein
MRKWEVGMRKWECGIRKLEVGMRKSEKYRRWENETIRKLIGENEIYGLWVRDSRERLLILFVLIPGLIISACGQLLLTINPAKPDKQFSKFPPSAFRLPNSSYLTPFP